MGYVPHEDVTITELSPMVAWGAVQIESKLLGHHLAMALTNLGNHSGYKDCCSRANTENKRAHRGERKVEDFHCPTQKKRMGN